MKRFFAVFALTCFFVAPLFAADTEKQLFRIERNTNANIVRYDIALNDDGTINSRRPIDSYWLMNADKGQRSEISTFERRAYGFSIKQNDSGGYFSMSLNAVKNKEIKVYIKDGEPKAEILINNKPAYLSYIYVDASSGMFGIPKVNFYMINGTDIETGQQVSEKVLNK